ncbi:MAG: hypothetical protein JST92_08320, partial [Deltaproteobacteria bacterium]|nr:hypothetical protein [Deltaproteobacteria bacterium]
MPDLVLRGARFDRLVEGRVVASGEAQALTLQRDDGRFMLEGVSAQVLPPAGSPAEARFGSLRLTAPVLTGEAPQRGAKASAVAAQGARIVSEQGDAMSAQRMELDGPADTIRASG